MSWWKLTSKSASHDSRTLGLSQIIILGIPGIVLGLSTLPDSFGIWELLIGIGWLASGSVWLVRSSSQRKRELAEGA